MEALQSSFLYSTPLKSPSPKPHNKPKPTIFSCSITPDPWTLSDPNNNKNLNKPKPKSKHPKNQLSDDNARRIIKAKAKYLSTLRRNQGSQALTPKWIKRTPEQMVQYLEDDRNGHLYGKHVVAAIKRVRSLSGKADGSYDMREVMGSFVTKLSFREMCVVLKEQKGWRQVRDFFAWMKLQLTYRPSVIVYTIVLRAYGQVGKIKLAEQTFLEMLEVGCEPDEVSCGTMLCAYARWGRHKAMISFFSAVQERGITLSTAVFNFMLSSLQKRSLHENVINIWKQMTEKGVEPNHFTFTVVISSLVKEGRAEVAFKTFNQMKSLRFIPEEATYSLLISLISKSGDYDDAFRLYEDMRSHGIIPSNFTCASLLTMYYRKEDYPKALALFEEMERYDIKIDEVIYGLLIRIYGKLGLYEDAQKTFEDVKKLGVISNEKTYTTMAQVHLNAGNIEEALNIMDEMKSKNISFSNFCYGILLRCHIAKEDLASAEAVFQALSKMQIPECGFCKDMLNLYMRLGLTEKAKDFIFQIRKIQVEFDEELLKTVLKVFCIEGMVRAAVQLIQEFSASKTFEESVFAETFSLAIHGNDRFNATEIASNPLNQPGAIAFELALILFIADGNTLKAEETLKLLLKTANGLSVASQLIRKFTKEGDISKAENLYKLLMKLGRKPEDVASASLIHFYGKQKNLRKALNVFASVADSSRTRSLLYNSIVDSYNRCDKQEEAYIFYKEEMEKGHVLGPVAISMLVNGLSNCGKSMDL
ncbi:Pentatricopeptide repeat-containing protein [Capsicum annuum]|nr:Pentatricopeptide repeat-containing protein [Capsicum annuum]